jgi:hypothetical protein
MGHGGNEQPLSHASLRGALATKQSILLSSGLDCFVIWPVKPDPLGSQ